MPALALSRFFLLREVRKSGSRKDGKTLFQCYIGTMNIETMKHLLRTFGLPDFRTLFEIAFTINSVTYPPNNCGEHQREYNMLRNQIE